MLIGRKVIVRTAASPKVVVAAGKSKSLKFGASPVPVTTDDDDGFRKILENIAGEKTVDMSFEGLAKDGNFIQKLESNLLTDDYEVVITGIGTIHARFVLTGVEIKATYNDAVSFSAEFQSTGAWSWVPAISGGG